MQFIFIHFVYEFFGKSRKGLNLGPLGYKRAVNHYISFFHLKIVSYIYKVLIIVQVQYKKSNFFSYWALYYTIIALSLMLHLICWYCLVFAKSQLKIVQVMA